MSEETQTPAEAEQDGPPPEASVELRMTPQGIDLQVYSDGNQANRCVHFAHWIGQNIEALMKLSVADYERVLSDRKREQKEAKALLEAPAPGLIGPDGKRLN